MAGTSQWTELIHPRCNRQIAAADLLRKGSDVTRSMVQKAVIVLASQPVFGPVRDRLGVVTRAFFAQRDFGNTQILEDFYESLNASLEGKAGENAIYMGESEVGVCAPPIRYVSATLACLVAWLELVLSYSC